MIRFALAFALSIALTGPALALSCLQPDVRRAYADADANPDEYIIAVGRLTPLPGQSIPQQPSDPNIRKGYSILTRFEGRFATHSGFGHLADADVLLQVDCLGPWCGAQPRGETLMFLLRRDGRLILEAGPCPAVIFPATPDALSLALSCLNGGPCAAP